MKKNWKFFVAITTSVLLFVGLLFLPYVSVEGSSKNTVEILFNEGFTWISFFIYIPFVLLILGVTSIFLRNKVKHIATIAMVVLLIAGFLFIFSPSFISINFALANEDVTLHAGAIIYGIIGFILTLLANAVVFDANRFSVRDIVEGAMLVSIAIVLDLGFFKFKIVPNGGSISLSMFPLSIIALRQGPIKGFIMSGVVYGFLTCLLDGYGFATFPFDYLLGFGSIALLGVFKKYIFTDGKVGYSVKGIIFLLLGVLLAGVGRTLSSTISGMLFYEVGFVDSLVYQLVYIPASIGLCLIALIGLYIPLQRINKKYPLNNNL